MFRQNDYPKSLMKPVLLLVLLLSCLALSAPAARACFCVTQDVPEAFDSARAVFLGEVTELIEPRSADEKAAQSLRLFVIKFKVIRAWKGVGFASQEISVLGTQGRSGCFYSPAVQKGVRYLVFADPADENGWSILGVCNRTTAVPPTKFFAADGIDPFFDMKRLDALPTRPRTFDNASFRLQSKARGFLWKAETKSKFVTRRQRDKIHITL